MKRLRNSPWSMTHSQSPMTTPPQASLTPNRPSCTTLESMKLLKMNLFCISTLWVLVQRTGGGAHAAVSALSHRQTLHLTEAALLTHALLMHSLHRLWEKSNSVRMKLVLPVTAVNHTIVMSCTLCRYIYIYCNGNLLNNFLVYAYSRPFHPE